MRKMLSLAATAAVALMATAANATTYIGTYVVTSNSSDNAGLQISTSHDFTLNFNLVGNNVSLNGATGVDLFDIWTNSNSLDGNDDNHKDISVAFTFTSPSPNGGTVTGDTFGVNGNYNNGQVTWDGPIMINFGATTLKIALDGAVFNREQDTNGYWWNGHYHAGCTNCLNGGSNADADVVAHFTQTINAGGVPEPASWALMIGGFGMAGAALRRRRTLAAVA